MSSIRFAPSIKKIILILSLLLLLILARNITVSIIASYKKAQMVEDLRTTLVQKKQEQALLSQKLYFAKTDEFIEDQARRKLGLVLPGEKVVIDQRIQDKNMPIIKQSTPVWLRWWRLFF